MQQFTKRVSKVEAVMTMDILDGRHGIRDHLVVVAQVPVRATPPETAACPPPAVDGRSMLSGVAALPRILLHDRKTWSQALPCRECDLLPGRSRV